MSELSKTLKIPTVKLTVGERTFTLDPYELGDYSAFEVWIEENGWAAIHRANAQRWVTPDQNKENVKNWLELLATDRLAHGSEAFESAIATYRGLEKMLSLALKKTPLSAEELYKIVHEDPAAVARAIRENRDYSD